MWLKDLVLQDVALCPALEITQQEAEMQEPQQCVQPFSNLWSAFDNLAGKPSSKCLTACLRTGN